MKTGQMTGLFARILGIGGTTTVCATQVAAMAHAGGAVANTSWLVIGASKVASAGFWLLGPVATGAQSLFGAAFGSHAAGALTAWLGGMYGAGLITAFAVPVVVGLCALAAYKVFASATRSGAEKLDHLLYDGIEERKAEAEAATKAKNQTPAQDPEKVPETALHQTAPPAPEEQPWHPANDAEIRGKSYRDDVLLQARARQRHLGKA